MILCLHTFFNKEENKAAEEQKNTPPPPKPKPRIYLLDELRGFAIFCMVFYHAFYSMGVFFNFEFGMNLLRFFMPAEPIFAGLFILISGICSNLSHSNIQRGTKLFFIAYAVTVISYFAVGKNAVIHFGILHMLSICMMFYGIIQKYLKIIPVVLGTIINTIIFILTYNVSNGTIGIPFIFNYKLPAEWYMTDFLYPLGFPQAGFISSDYFPLFPWIFLFLTGCFIGRLAAKNKFPKFASKKHIPFFCVLGKHSLIIYLAHQPVIFGICYAVKWIMSLKS